VTAPAPSEVMQVKRSPCAGHRPSHAPSTQWPEQSIAFVTTLPVDLTVHPGFGPGPHTVCCSQTGSTKFPWGSHALTMAPFVPWVVPFTVGFKSSAPPASATHSTENEPASPWPLLVPDPPPSEVPLPLPVPVALAPLLEPPLPAVPLPAAPLPAPLPLLTPEPVLAAPVEEPPSGALAFSAPHPTTRNARRTRRAPWYIHVERRKLRAVAKWST
jgi:hypothetical protein